MPIAKERRRRSTTPSLPTHTATLAPPNQPNTPSSHSHALENWSEDDLLAAILRTGGPKAGTAQDQAKRIAERYPSLHQLAKAGTGELTQLEGITQAKADAIRAAFELGRRWLSQPLQHGQPYTSAHSVFLAYAPKLAHYEQETFWVLLLNQRNHLLRQLQIRKGSINRCPLMPQDVFAPAMREKAVRMILIHNHPSGDPEPSPEDRSLTRRIDHIAKLLCIQLLDHIVIGHKAYVSFADRGWL
jgi:DNA repair protein RadC